MTKTCRRLTWGEFVWLVELADIPEETPIGYIDIGGHDLDTSSTWRVWPRRRTHRLASSYEYGPLGDVQGRLVIRVDENGELNIS